VGVGAVELYENQREAVYVERIEYIQSFRWSVDMSSRAKQLFDSFQNAQSIRALDPKSALLAPFHTSAEITSKAFRG
jgi:hypothetical protein